MRAVPHAVMLLGLSGLLPFFWGVATYLSPAAFDLTMLILGPRFVAPFVLLSYGSIILAFMAGVLWGFATRAQHSAWVFYAVSVIPALWAAYIKHGSPEDNQEEWYDWAGKAILGEIAGTVPFVRDAWSMIEYSHSSSEVAPIRILHDVVKVGNDVIGEFNDRETKIIQDAANMLGELLHIGGLGQAGKTAQYLRELEQGKQDPQSTAELIHDAALGHKEKH